METVVGPVEFADDHTATLPLVEAQWQDGKSVVVWPDDKATGKIIFPLP